MSEYYYAHEGLRYCGIVFIVLGWVVNDWKTANIGVICWIVTIAVKQKKLEAQDNEN